jgi:hypothetical protein
MNNKKSRKKPKIDLRIVLFKNKAKEPQYLYLECGGVVDEGCNDCKVKYKCATKSYDEYVDITEEDLGIDIYKTIIKGFKIKEKK